MSTVATLVDELMDERDDHGQGSEQPLNHGSAALEPPTDPQTPIDPAQPQTVNEQTFTKATIGPQAQIGPAPLQTANEPSFAKATTSPLAPICPAAPQTANELPDICIIVSYYRVSLSVSQHFTCYSWRVTTFCLLSLGCHKVYLVIHGVSQHFTCLHGVSQHFARYLWRVTKFILLCMTCHNILLVLHGGPSHSVGLEHDDADDGQHHEPGVDIDDDVFGVDGEHVTHVDDVIEEAVAVDVTLQSDDAEGEHLPPVDAFVDAAAGAIVLYRGSTLDVVEIRSSSPEPSAVHHEDYEAFKKEESARRNVDILGDQRADFFTTLEDPNEAMTSEHIDACLNLLCKRMTGLKSKLYITRACVVDTIFFDNIRMLHTKFSTENALATMQISDELRGYVEGERPTYAKKWEDMDFILAPWNFCGHWVVAKIDLVRWTIKAVDSVRTSDAKANGVRAGQMTPLTTMMPFICHQAGYFNSIHWKRRDLTSMPLDIHLPKAKVHR
ncbi:Ulp1 protease family [Theobroma cacao]|nr:Ulp1 protease family [Theobroma cacao]